MEPKKALNWLFFPPVHAPAATVLIRMLAGLVFFSEGILKFVYVNQGVGRFTKLGFPMPAELAHVVAVWEIAGGLLLLAGWMTRPVAIAFILEMIVAVLSTKIGLYYGTSPLPKPAAAPFLGPWAVLHETRSDYAQIMSCLFLLLAGPGRLSVDAARAAEAKRIKPR